MINQKLIVMDVMPLLYRGHFAFLNRPRMTSSGINTSALYIFATLVREMLQEGGASHLALVMDTAPTFRHEQYPLYKAQREKLPEDIADSIPRAEAFAQAMNIPFLRVPGFEADDLMGTLAAWGEAAGMTTWLVTPDKDLAQLVTARTFLCRPPGKGQTENQIYDIERVCQEWQIQSPAQMVDFLGLAGDSADNIPGIPGIGPKTATQLLADYGSIENLIAHASELKGKLAEKVASNVESARISRWLAEIRRDAPIPGSLDDLVCQAPDAEALLAFCQAYEMPSLYEKIFPNLKYTPASSSSKDAVRSPASSARMDSADSSADSSHHAPSEGDVSVPLHTCHDTPHHYHLVNTAEDLSALASTLSQATAFAFDTETTGLDARHAQLVGISFAVRPHEAYYVPVRVASAPSLSSSSPQDELPLFQNLFCGEPNTQQACNPSMSSPPPSKGEQLFFNFDTPVASDSSAEPSCGIAPASVSPSFSSAEVLEALGPCFANPAIAKIGHNLKFDLHVLQSVGFKIEGPLFDSMLAHYVYDASARHGMDPLAREFLQYDPIPITELIGERGKNQLTMDQVDVQRVAEYAAEDADITLQLHQALWPLVQSSGAMPVLEQCENPLIRVLTEMESEGVRIDPSALALASQELALEITDLEKEIHSLAGLEFNIASNQQLAKVLFEHLKLPAGGKTTQGHLSTSEEVLQEINHAHPIIQKILDYRACSKLKSTYVDKLPRCIDPLTGRIHTSFNQALTETGRLSSDHPNLQNIPVRSARGRRIRAAFVARDAHHRLIAADYSQIELRIMASMSGDPSMIAAFIEDQDIHLDTASRVYDVPREQVTPAMRSYCKMVNFGIIYGISAFGLAQRLGTTRTKADELIKTYFELYPGIQAYRDKTIAEAREKGYVTTLLGRRRPLRDIQSRNGTVRAAAERLAINTPVQGSAADLIKLAMVVVSQKIKEHHLKTRLVLQVHDELVFDTPESEVEAVIPIIRESMTQVLSLAVPLKVEIGVGQNWLEAH